MWTHSIRGDRAILFNLRDQDNPDFRRRVLSGEIQPERVSMMDSVEMASDELKRQRSIYASISLQSVTQGSAEDQYAVRHAHSQSCSSLLFTVLFIIIPSFGYPFTHVGNHILQCGQPPS